MVVFIKNFSKRLNELIKERKINQIDIVKNTNISASSINDYVSGKYFPKRENLIKLAMFFNVNPDWLSGDSDSKDNIMDYIVSNSIDNANALYYYILERILSDSPQTLINFIITNKETIDKKIKEKKGEEKNE